jgi:hypothetical protein
MSLPDRVRLGRWDRGVLEMVGGLGWFETGVVGEPSIFVLISERRPGEERWD